MQCENNSHRGRSIINLKVCFLGTLYYQLNCSFSSKTDLIWVCSSMVRVNTEYLSWLTKISSILKVILATLCKMGLFSFSKAVFFWEIHKSQLILTLFGVLAFYGIGNHIDFTGFFWRIVITNSKHYVSGVWKDKRTAITMNVYCMSSYFINF